MQIRKLYQQHNHIGLFNQKFVQALKYSETNLVLHVGTATATKRTVHSIGITDYMAKKSIEPYRKL